MTAFNSNRFSGLDQGGFTLIEIVITMIVVGILAAVAIPKFSTMTDSSKIIATKEELTTLKKGIIGNPATISGGELIDRGYEGDNGFAPSQLLDLAKKPDSVSPYNRLTRLGWNGPYIDSSGGVYLKDAWGNNYIYSLSSRYILSVNGTDSIKVTF